MASLTCPKCKKRISVFDLACFNCGCVITEEERDRQVRELEKHNLDDSSKDSSPQERALKHYRKQKILKKLNLVSFGFFKIGWGEIVVPSIIIILIIIMAVLMII